MQIKLLKSLVEELAGVLSGPIIDILFNKKDVNEFLIAKKMNLTINQVRNILYKLSAEGLVSFIRKKDKRKGWYIYYWTLNTEKCLMVLEKSLIKKIDDLKHLLNSRESKSFYICKSCNIEVSEETALEHGFTCEECAEVYTLSDNDAPIRDFKAKISRKERELRMIQGELESIREKLAKKRASQEKKDLKSRGKKVKKIRKKIEGKKSRGKEKLKREVKKKPAKNIKKKSIKKVMRSIFGKVKKKGGKGKSSKKFVRKGKKKN